MPKLKVFQMAAGLLATGSLLFGVQSSWAEDGAKELDWQHYANTHASTKYSPAAQVNAENVKNLKRVWSWKAPGRGLRSVPLVVNGVMYIAGTANSVAALDPATGKEIWSFDANPTQAGAGGRGGRGGGGAGNLRGIEYWTDGKEERVIIGTAGLRLIAIDAKTGKACAGFGEELGGYTDLNKGLGVDGPRAGIGLSSPVVVCRDTIVVGSTVGDYGTSKEGAPGHVRGYDVRTGKMKWIFHTVPQKGEFGIDTWEDGSWEYTGNTNVWSLMSADDELGYVYLPLTTPTSDHYGGMRHGNNLFAESVVCLEAATGKRVWHFQAVHHGIWDYDFPAAPNLVDITVDGKKIKAVAQVSKQGFTYVFDRTNGTPVWPITEKPVPQSDVPGEKTSPTQPFPTKPPAFDRQGILEEDLIDFTPELHKEALEIARANQIGPLFTPPIVSGTNGKIGTILIPGMGGGANWPGAAFDPDSGLLYIQSVTWPGYLGLKPGDPDRGNLAYVRATPSRIKGPQGLELVKPPWGRITAIDLNKGEIAWQVPHGPGPIEHPALKGVNTGWLGSNVQPGLEANGPMLTKTLLFVNQGVPATYADDEPSTGVMRAYDKKTGKIVWENKIDEVPSGPPMTYVHKGKQYIAFSGSGGDGAGVLMAYALP